MFGCQADKPDNPVETGKCQENQMYDKLDRIKCADKVKVQVGSESTVHFFTFAEAYKGQSRGEHCGSDFTNMPS